MNSIKVKVSKGISGRNVYTFLSILSNIKSKVLVRKNELDRCADGKSVLGILSLCVLAGDEIEIMAESKDELERVKQLMENEWLNGIRI